MVQWGNERGNVHIKQIATKLTIDEKIIDLNSEFFFFYLFLPLLFEPNQNQNN